MLSSRVLSQTWRPAVQSLRQTVGRRMASSVTSEDQVAHTVTRRVKKWATTLPIEIYPLFVTMGFSLGFGIYSFVKSRKDPTLRLHRSGLQGQGHNSPMNWREQVAS
ncbi:hypothetical protein BDV97DRAFT_357500, partial [Delphinella strobiligena]